MNASTVRAPGEQGSADAEAAFWREVRRRRNHFFYVWWGWLVAGPILWGGYSLLFGLHPFESTVAGSAALVTWGAFWHWVAFRLRKLRCVRCHERAFDHALFFMRHAACRNCGLAYRK